MLVKPVFLLSDILLYILIVAVIGLAIYSSRQRHLRKSWSQVFKSSIGMSTFMIICAFVVIALSDSMHYRARLPEVNGHSHYSTQVHSVLDRALAPMGQNDEKTYSAPFASKLYSKESIRTADGQIIRDYPALKYTNGKSVQSLLVKSILQIGVFAIVLLLLFCEIIQWNKKQGLVKAMQRFAQGKSAYPLRSMYIIALVLFSLAVLIHNISQNYHILGTDKVGADVLYAAIKSIRTGLLIGTITTLVMLPFALLLGTMAGYFGGWLDDIIQYIYTTLSSIPGVLLIAAAILSIQVYIANHPDVFQTVASRADARLVALCVILGITSWTNLCRVLRAETLKLRELDYISAAKALGVNWFTILNRHVLPNLMHIVLITIALDFSNLVLAEAVLTYVGVGVDPTTMSWGNIIDGARLELAREPIVWWPLLSAFVFMFTFVLAANLFADTLRDAFDPRVTHSGSE